ncbi:MAG: DUF2442 domain-containing protein [Acidobacteria bacterium]|nr:DUF2442 domain-containing protein [Acidobacteriota bacterium]
MATIKAGKWTMTDEEFERQYAEATKRGKEEMAAEIQARAASYDRASDRLIIDLKNGATFIIPCDLIQGLRDAGPDDIAAVELGPRGASLHWEKLDQDFTVGGLAHGIFGTKAWMKELGRAGGRVKSRAKAAASRANGKKGGRSRKAAAGATLGMKRGRKAA